MSAKLFNIVFYIRVESSSLLMDINELSMTCMYSIDVVEHIYHTTMTSDSKIWRHQMEAFSAQLAICAGNSPGNSSVNSPHEGQWRGALMFSLICGSINAWVNNRETGDLRRHHAHYDVIEMHYHSGGRFVSYAWNGANMGPIWGRQDPGRPHVGPMNFAIWRASRCCVIHTDWRVQLWWISSNCYEVSKKSKHLPFIMFMSIHKLIRQVTDIMCNQYIALMITLAKGWGCYHDFSCTCW